MSLVPRIGKEDSLADKAYTIVKNAIIRNHLKPNVVLTEEQLASDLGISRTPVREALRRLEYEKLVRFNRGRGAIVAEISKEDAWHIFDVRQVIEPLAAKMSARYIEQHEVEELRALIVAQKECMASGDYIVFLQKDSEFHISLARAGRNDILHEIVRGLTTHVQRSLILSRNLPIKAPLATDEHALILDALEAHDEVAAERAMLDHVIKIRERLLDIPGTEVDAGGEQPRKATLGLTAAGDR